MSRRATPIVLTIEERRELQRRIRARTSGQQAAQRAYSAERQARILVVACQSPAELGWSGQTHWSVRDLARSLDEHPEVGAGRPSTSMVGTILQAADVRLEWL